MCNYDLPISTQAIYDIKLQAARLPSGMTPVRKVVIGSQKNITEKTDGGYNGRVNFRSLNYIPQPKRIHTKFIFNASPSGLYTIVYRRHGITILITMMNESLQLFSMTNQHWTLIEWIRVLISNESTFIHLREGSKLV